MKKTHRALAASTALALGATVTLGAASAAQAVDIWTITSLTLDNPIVIDTDALAGDDGGLLSITQSHVLRDGDVAVYAYDLVTLDPVAAAGASPSNSFVYASDLKTNTAYQVVTSGALTQLVALDDDGNTTSTVVTLSETIESDPASDNDFLISGYGWIGIWEINVLASLKVINPATGEVTTLDTNIRDDYSPQPNTSSEGIGDFDGGGVGMFDGTDYWYVGSDANGDISKFNITGDPLASVMLENDMTDSPDSDTFMFSASACRFFIHDEGPGDLWFGQVTTGMSEPMLSADATCSTPDSAELELSDTGVNAGEATAIAAVLGVLGALAVLVARRRQVSAR
jgi:hypothetical protein